MAKYPAAFETLEGVVRLSGELDFVDAITQPARIAVVTLTNAQIRALPTTPVALVPKTETPNYAAVPATLPLPLPGGLAILDTLAGVYANADATLRLALCWGADQSADLTFAQAQFVYANTPTQFTNADVSTFPLGGVDFFGINSLQNAMLDNGLYVAMTNGALGNLTGGNAANTLRVAVPYMLVNV